MLLCDVFDMCCVLCEMHVVCVMCVMYVVCCVVCVGGFGGKFDK